MDFQSIVKGSDAYGFDVFETEGNEFNMFPCEDDNSPSDKIKLLAFKALACIPIFAGLYHLHQVSGLNENTSRIVRAGLEAVGLGLICLIADFCFNCYETLMLEYGSDPHLSLNDEGLYEVHLDPFR